MKQNLDFSSALKDTIRFLSNSNRQQLITLLRGHLLICRISIGRNNYTILQLSMYPLGSTFSQDILQSYQLYHSSSSSLCLLLVYNLQSLFKQRLLPYRVWYLPSYIVCVCVCTLSHIPQPRGGPTTPLPPLAPICMQQVKQNICQVVNTVNG